MNKKIKRMQAPSPALEDVPSYFLWNRASNNKTHASVANPVTETSQLSWYRTGKYLRRSTLRPNLSNSHRVKVMIIVAFVV